MNNHVFIVTIEDTDPERLVQEYCKKLSASADSAIVLLVTYPFEQYWLSGDNSFSSRIEVGEKVEIVDGGRVHHPSPVIKLAALYYLSVADGETIVKVAVSDGFCAFDKFVLDHKESITESSFISICHELQLPYFSSNSLLEFEPVSIAKPWGQEIWYTGVEERGVASFTAQGFSSPIPWVLSSLPSAFCKNAHQSLVLLKILDPYPDPAFGDLYFELHEEKREVYVVTAIDSVAWPSGKGAIRFGFNQEKRKEHGSDESFRSSFLAAVEAYEAIRLKIDDYIDALRDRDGVGENQLVDNTVSRMWLGEVPEDWVFEELALREAVEAFTDKISLSVGDVIKVPCLTPHSLQHGVRTIEFQTPVYERLIVSFNQKVQTQSGWDTKKATEVMTLEPVDQGEILNIGEVEGVKQEKIVEFEDFDVARIELDAGAEFNLTGIERYCVIICIKGTININADSLMPERAALLAETLNGSKIVSIQQESACFLIANPK